MIGIYRIRNKINGKCYIGASLHLEETWKRHYNLLRNNEDSKLLQEDWNKFGEDNFEFNIIDECKEMNLASKELHWIKEVGLKPKGYNMRLQSIVYRHTEDARRRISETLSKVNMGKSYPSRVKPQQQKEIIREDISERNSGLGNGRTKLTLEQCKEIKSILDSGKGIKEVAEMFDISTYPIGKIKRGTHWSCKEWG